MRILAICVPKTDFVHHVKISAKKILCEDIKHLMALKIVILITE